MLTSQCNMMAILFFATPFICTSPALADQCQHLEFVELKQMTTTELSNAFCRNRFVIHLNTIDKTTADELASLARRYDKPLDASKQDEKSRNLHRENQACHDQIGRIWKLLEKRKVTWEKLGEKCPQK